MKEKKKQLKKEGKDQTVEEDDPEMVRLHCQIRWVYGESFVCITATQSCAFAYSLGKQCTSRPWSCLQSLKSRGRKGKQRICMKGNLFIVWMTWILGSVVYICAETHNQIKTSGKLLCFYVMSFSLFFRKRAREEEIEAAEKAKREREWQKNFEVCNCMAIINHNKR